MLSEGRVKKFVTQVEQVSFSGSIARESGHDVLIVTERAVFRLQPGGVELIEIAPGIDIDKDVLAQMEFAPLMTSVGVMKI